MTGRGSIRHNNRSFSAANVDRSRSGQNVTFCNEDLKKVYHELFDEALATYNAKKKKTRDKIPDYYEHIRQSKQEKLFHEAIFQIGNLTDCGCGSPGGERAAAALKEFAESFQERNPHLRVFNMVLHMDEATPHLHVDFVPVATEQSRGLSTRVSMKQALKQQGFEGLGRKQTEWKAWMEREKEALTEIAQAHEFEIISLGGGRTHMELPEYRAAAQRLEAVQEQVIAAEQEILGIHGGVLGETCALAIVLGFVYLVVTKTISPAIPLSYVGSMFVFYLIATGSVHESLVEVLSGGLLFGAVFMATDYVTSPFTLKGKLLYGICLGVVTFAIRYWGSYTEGVSFALLFMNLWVPFINDATRQTPYGYVKPAKKAGKEGASK